jgi:hypothetical protein
VPDAPVIPSSLPFLRGEREDLLASALQGKAILYCFFRASEYDTNLPYFLPYHIHVICLMYIIYK